MNCLIFFVCLFCFSILLMCGGGLYRVLQTVHVDHKHLEKKNCYLNHIHLSLLLILKAKISVEDLITHLQRELH